MRLMVTLVINVTGKRIYCHYTSRNYRFYCFEASVVAPKELQNVFQTSYDHNLGIIPTFEYRVQLRNKRKKYPPLAHDCNDAIFPVNFFRSPGAVFTTLHFLRNLQTGPIS
jgi:hypothetical protein